MIDLDKTILSSEISSQYFIQYLCQYSCIYFSYYLYIEIDTLLCLSKSLFGNFLLNCLLEVIIKHKHCLIHNYSKYSLLKYCPDPRRKQPSYPLNAHYKYCQIFYYCVTKNDCIDDSLIKWLCKLLEPSYTNLYSQ